MEIIIFLAPLLAIIEMKRRSIADALINVYLPALLLVPGFYSIHIPHLPALGFEGATIIPLGIAIFKNYRKEWKFQRSDLWILIFILAFFYSELSSTGPANGGLVLFGAIISCFTPYMIGKLFLEQPGVRERFLRRFVLILFFVAILSVTEFRLGLNVFTTFFGLFFPGQMPWVMQIRGGFIRAAGPYTGAILAGMVFLIGWVFSLWLGYMDRSRGNERKYLGLRRSTILSLGLVFGLLLTQSRGPEIGAILAYVIARVGRAKNMRRAAIITALLCAIGGTVGYIKAEQYTAGSIWDAKDMEQENAIYRRELLDNYKPIVEKGGLFGYGVVDWPRVPGQNSIDNEFLFLQITQGKVGFWMYILLCVEAMISIFKVARKFTQRADIYFALCLGGALVGLLMTLTTVYMGAQSYPLFFFLIGWSQSVRQTQSASETQMETAQSRFKFRKVFA